MTRAESYLLQREIERNDYLNSRERRLAYARQYAREHREILTQQQRERRRMKAAGTFIDRRKIEREERNAIPSTDACEEALPLHLRCNKQRLRDEFLRIHITERPTYDYFLRCKTIEYMRDYERERRKYNHPDIIKPI